MLGFVLDITGSPGGLGVPFGWLTKFVPGYQAEASTGAVLCKNKMLLSKLTVLASPLSSLEVNA